MSMRLTLAAAVALITAAFASAEPINPPIVFQAKPVARLLSDAKEIVRQVAGPVEGDQAVKGFESDIKEALGEKGFEGLDLNRPLAAYAVLKDKPEDCGLVLVLPTTGEKEFVAFLERIKVTAEAVKDKPGLYALTLPEALFPKASHLRFAAGGWAYITLNDGEPTDAKHLVPIGDLLDNADQSLVSVKIYPGRVPAKLVAGLLDELDKTATGLKQLFGAAVAPNADAKLYTTILDQGPKLLRRYVETGLKEANEVGVKFGFDPMTGDTVTELTVVPKPGTGLAKDIAAQGATTNRFAGLVTKDAAVGLTLKAPLFAPELREIGASLFEAVAAGAKQSDLPATFLPVVDELVKGFTSTVKKGEVDGAIALIGPDKAGKFAVIGAVSFDDTAALEKELRKAAKPAELAKHFEFDIAKAGTVGIHKIPLTRLFGDRAMADIAKAFGDNPPGYIAFAKDAIYVGFGAGALDALKTAIETKPGPAPWLDVTWNSGRLQKFVAAMDEKAGLEFTRHVGTDDKPATALRVTAEGGQSLKVKLTFNVRYLPKLLMARSVEVVAPPGNVNPGK